MNYAKNGSGYFDETAYKAIKRTEGVNETMNVKKGEIWEYDGDRECVIVSDNDANQNGASMCLTLVEFHNPYNMFESAIQSRGGKRYTDCGKISYVFHNRLGNMVKVLTDDELRDVETKISKALGISEKQVVEVEKEVIKEVVKEIPAENKEELVKAQAERDVYKSLYKELLAEMV